MAGNRIGWIFDLIDKMSGPASRIADSVRRVETNTAATASAIDRLVNKSGRGLLSLASDLGNVVSGFAHGAQMIGGLVGGIYDVGMGLARAAIDAASFRAEMRRGFEIAAGPGGGDRLIGDAIHFAEKFSRDSHDMMSQFLTLMQGGFSEQESGTLINAIEDLAAAGQGNKTGAIINAIRQIRGKGVLQMEELQQQLAESGINVGEVLSIIGESRKMTGMEVRKLVSKGGVASGEGVNAIVEFIRRRYSRGGVLGASGVEASEGIAGLERVLQARPKLFFGQLEKSKGLEAYRKMLLAFRNATSPESEAGRRIIERVGDSFNRVFKQLFGSFEGAEGAAKVERFIERVLGGFERFVAGVQVGWGFLSGVIGSVTKGIAPALDDLFNGPMDPKKIAAMTSSARDFGRAMGAAVLEVVEMIRSLGELLGIVRAKETPGKQFDQRAGFIDKLRMIKAVETGDTAGQRDLLQKHGIGVPTVAAPDFSKTTPAWQKSVNVNSSVTVNAPGARASDADAIGRAVATAEGEELRRVLEAWQHQGVYPSRAGSGVSR